MKKIIQGSIDLRRFNLTELPDLSDVHVAGNFDCEGNHLMSLKGAPASVGGSFFCGDNPGKFTEEDVRDVCKVGIRIFTY